MNSRFSLILIACVLIFGGILFFNKKEAKSPENKNNISRKKILKGLLIDIIFFNSVKCKKIIRFVSGCELCIN